MKKLFEKSIVMIFVLALIMSTTGLSAFAEEEGSREQPESMELSSDGHEHALAQGEGRKAKRTILLYDCGSDLETRAGMATYNLKQILRARFSSDDDIKVIVMTGGSDMWQLDDDNDTENANSYLVFPEGVNVPDDAVVKDDPEDSEKKITLNPKGRISGVYNQIWEAKGADSPENAGKMVLLDGDGITGAEGEAVPGKDELMSEASTLEAFINFCAENYPAEKYDLILWDHGGGPVDGFGSDEHYEYESGKSYVMHFDSIADALAHNKVTDTDSDGKPDSKFDFVDFDACLMGSIELTLGLADYADYYIASADTEPGYGQYYGPCEGKYKGWLDELGDPAKDDLYNGDNGTFEIGKVIVDDFYEFYEKDEGDGSSQEGTLAIFDTQKMIKSGFIQAMMELFSILRSQAAVGSDEQGMFYDEIISFYESIDYADTRLFDIGDLIMLLGIKQTEFSEADIVDGRLINRNEYTDLAQRFTEWFQPEGEGVRNEFMYARGTLGEKTESKYHYIDPATDEYGDNYGYGSLFSTGLTIYFPDRQASLASTNYYKATDPVLENMPVKDDGRYDLLREYQKVVADYSILMTTASTVDQKLNEEGDWMEPDRKNKAYGDREKITYDVVMKYWKDYGLDIWDEGVKVHLDKIGKSEEDIEPWLRRTIERLAKEVVSAEEITSTRVKEKNGDGYKVKVHNARKSMIDSIERNVIAELPVMEKYLESLDENRRRTITRYKDLSVGSVEGTIGDMADIESMEDLIKWYSETGMTMDVDALEPKWYAVHDADSEYHVASIYHRDKDGIYVPALYGTSEDGREEDRLVMLEFSNKFEDGDHHVLTSVVYMNTESGAREIEPDRLTGDVTVMPIKYIRPMFADDFYVPISKASFVISAENASKISLDFTDISNIKDIEDIDEDGEVLDSSFTVTDIFGYPINITDKVLKAEDGKLTHIELAEVKPATATGKELVPEITYNGETLTAGVDYTWEKVSEVEGEGEQETYRTPEFKKPGVYEINLFGKGEFTGYSWKEFRITKADNPLAVKGRTAKVSSRKLRKKTQKLAVTRVLKFTKKGKGTVTYTKVSGSKKIAINKKTGKVTVKKGLKKGKYKVTVKVKAAGGDLYKSAAKTVKITIRVV